MDSQREVELFTKAFIKAKQVFSGIKLLNIKLKTEGNKMAFIKFTQEEVGESQPYDLIPPGRYTVNICNHEWKKTKAGGHLLALTLEIVDPTHVGRKIFDNINIDCASVDAQKIAVRTFKSICDACNEQGFYEELFTVNDLSDAYLYFEQIPEYLYAKDILINLGIEVSKNPEYPDKNKVKGYYPALKIARPLSNSKPQPAQSNKPAWSQPQSHQPKPSNQQPAGYDDDIPF